MLRPYRCLNKSLPPQFRNAPREPAKVLENLIYLSSFTKADSLACILQIPRRG